ncbi:MULTISPECIES: MarR family winged helix-turn-helix transcriptional regulator [Amycolatopsis]|uniref:MarR family transcriptional regulator n=1 Tax=Amycolatopsis thermalba TaxID=944492 RepID=A0ABY4NTJ0_9PSEU|nr:MULTISPECIES: MarR family transcriptional regulator [Amycolatopsis]OXM66173.1 MarR family transcriptional regulator [Amycolatopsis sp. KNN50.9b]UQS23368.1 MarR family transcriptional regulator [Amycolatopsis thermalba]
MTDLGASLARIVRRLMKAEEPVLREHGLSMWAYAALSSLAERPATSQLALAKAIGYDKTRLIGLLDELAEAGLVVRERDPADRRSHIVRLTPDGEARHAAARAGIRALEDELLGALSAAEQRAFRAMLARIADEA